MLRNTAESDNARMPDKDNLRDLEDSELKFVPISIQQLACDSGGKLREVQRRSRRPVRLVIRALPDAKDYVDYILGSVQIVDLRSTRRRWCSRSATPMRQTGFDIYSANVQAGMKSRLRY